MQNPLRCYRCQRFGHHESRCKSEIERCKKCGDDADFHNESNCPNLLKCVNCNGSHEVTSKSCPSWIKEKEILKIKYTQNISFPEARKIVNDKYTPISETTSYANITKTASVHTSVGVDSCTQTPLGEFDAQPTDVIIVPTVGKKTRTESSLQPSTSNNTINTTPRKNQHEEQTKSSSSNNGKTPGHGQSPDQTNSQQKQTTKGGKSSGHGQSPGQAKSPPKQSSRRVSNANSPVSLNRYDVLSMESEDYPSDDVETKPQRSPVKPPK